MGVAEGVDLFLRGGGEPLGVGVREKRQEGGEEKERGEEFFFREAGHLEGDEFAVGIEVDEHFHRGEEEGERKEKLKVHRVLAEIVGNRVGKRGGAFREEADAVDRQIDHRIAKQNAEENKEKGFQELGKEITVPNFHTSPREIRCSFKKDAVQMRRWGRRKARVAKRG